MQQVLIIDDSPLSLQVYERIFRQIGNLEITTFESSTTGLTWAIEHDPDLIVIDYQMPSPNGLEFIEAFRKVNVDTPLVMITGSKESEVRHRALELGADDFLQKPADIVECRARARNLLKLRDRGKKLGDRAAWLEEEVRAATAHMVERERETINRLACAVEYRDKETKNHIVRMGHYCRLLANAIDLPEDLQELYLVAAPMHDIGKVTVPDSILLKKGSLTPPEWETMKTHAQAGYDILRGSSSPLIELAAEIALAHHEKYDGSGYPAGRRGDAIPLSGRICAIADVFDALLSDRPYKRAWPLPDVIANLERGRSAHFDPVLVDAFLNRLPDLQAIRHEFDDGGAEAQLAAT